MHVIWRFLYKWTKYFPLMYELSYTERENMGGAMIFIKNILVAICAAGLSAMAVASSYTIYVYHDDAPYSIPADTTDISREWVKQANARQQQIKLELKHIDRPILNSMVESGQPYIILWANELWFKFRDKNVKSSRVIFWDADTLVSLLHNPISYHNPKELIGLRVGARYGHYYSDLNQLFKEDKVHRIDARSSLENYLKLKNGIISAFLDGRSTILYMQKKLVFSRELFVSSNPQDAYSRHVLVSKHYEWMLPTLNRVIDEMNNDREWQSKMEQWGLSELVNPFELDLKELDQL